MICLCSKSLKFLNFQKWPKFRLLRIFTTGHYFSCFTLLDLIVDMFGHSRRLDKVNFDSSRKRTKRSMHKKIIGELISPREFDLLVTNEINFMDQWENQFRKD